MDREHIIRALECCICLGENENCPNCKYNTEYLKGSSLLIDALALIKSQKKELVKCYTDKAKLTEENAYLKHIELEVMRGKANSYKIHNEKLTEENERLRLDVEVLGAELSRYTENIVQMAEQHRVDTVQKYRESLHREFASLGVNDKFNKEFFLTKADQIAKEMLEKNNGQG